MKQSNIMISTFILLFIMSCSSGASNPSSLKIQKRTEHFTFLAETKADNKYISEISTTFENNYNKICTYIGYFPKEKIDVEVFSDLQNALGYPGRINGYAGNGKIQLNNPGNDSEYYEYMLRVPLHEMVHVILNKANNGLSERWISEGLAEYLADGPRTKEVREQYLKLAVVKTKDYGLFELSMAFSSGQQEEAIIAYAVAFDFVEYLTRNYGSNCIKKLVTARMNYDKVFDRQIGDIYSEYLNSLRARYSNI